MSEIQNPAQIARTALSGIQEAVKVGREIRSTAKEVNSFLDEEARARVAWKKKQLQLQRRGDLVFVDLLALSVKEDPHCPRNAFYYARELTFHARWHDAIKELHRYLALPGATWPNERCYAYRLLGKSHAELGDQRQSEKFYQLAASEAPNTREPWCELAMLYYRQRRWPDCYASSMRALEIKDRQLVYTCDPAVWGYWAHDLAAVAAWNMGMKGVAEEQARLALELSPEDPRLQENLRFMTEGPL